MTPNEKAEQIVDRFKNHPLLFQMPNHDDAKIYALFVVNELLKAIV